MTHKVRSLVYFFCFLVASSVLYVMEQQDQFNESITSETVVETQFQDSDDFEETQKVFKEEQQ